MNDNRAYQLDPAGMVTPEAVAIDMDIAGLGSRVVALVIDSMVQTGVIIVALLAGLALSAAGVPSELLKVAGIVAASVLLLGYHALFEGLWDGRTPGKAGTHLRVVMQDGQPLSWGPVLVRNVLRLVDQLLFIGAVSVVATERSQRLGDLAAQTIVIREGQAPAPRMLDFPPDGDRDVLVRTLDTSGVTEPEYALVRSFLERRDLLRPAPRSEVAGQLAGALEAKVGARPPSAGKEQFLEAIALSVRQRAR